MYDEYFVVPWQGKESSFIENCDQIRRIIDHISDKTSRDIYINRLLYSITLDLKYIHNIISMTDVGLTFEQKLDKMSVGKPVLIYGAGRRGKRLVGTFPNKNWAGFIDMHKRGEWRNLPVKSLEEYPDLSEAVILISNHLEYEDIKFNLCERGADPENMIVLQEWVIEAEKKQYFENRCIQPAQIKSFVDAGCFDGATSIQFANWVNDLSCKIWAFEPDSVQYEACKTNLASLPSSKLYMMALSDKESIMKMDLVGGGRSHLNVKGKEETVEVTATSMDALLGNEKIDYIKMDLEGWELYALSGAEKIIREQKPALAISLYHRRDDVLEIPNLLLKYNPEYRFALGHYDIIGHYDTVLYAVNS